MEFLRLLFGLRPVDKARRQLRKAERQLLEVERDLEMTIAVRDYLVKHIARLDVVIASEGARRLNTTDITTQGRFPFVSRPIYIPPRPPSK